MNISEVEMSRRTLEKYAQARAGRVTTKHVVEASQEQDSKRSLSRLFDQWNPQVNALLNSAGAILWPSKRSWPWRWLANYTVIADRRHLRWQLCRKRFRIREKGEYQHTYALGYEGRLTGHGFDLTVGDKIIESPFDLACLEDALVRLLENEPDGYNLHIRSARYHRWFIHQT
jgi:hypothetical protein